jgi:hypothetical protein
MGWVRFPPGEEPIVRREDLCAVSGGCQHCPGIAFAKEFSLEEDDPKELIFCDHGCHRIAH